MDALNTILRKEAVELGLCQQWQSEWLANKSVPQLIRMFKRGIDFCIEHDWPDAEWIRENFSRDELAAEHVYASEEDSVVDAVGVTVLKGCSDVTVNVRHHEVVTMHCIGCRGIRVNAANGSIVQVHLHDSAASLTIGSSGHASVRFFKH